MLFLSSNALNFGLQQIGTVSAAQSVVLSNTGSAPLMLGSVGASGDFGAVSNCGASLAAGAQCTISVTFSPTGTGIRTGTLAISDNAGNSPQTVSLTGTGAGLPIASLNAGAVNFGSQRIGTVSAAQSVVLSNTGSAPLMLGSVGASGDFGAVGNCGASLAAGAQCTISVTFSPTGTGIRTGTLAISDNAGNSPQTVSLTGTGAGLPIASLNSNALNFGS